MSGNIYSVISGTGSYIPSKRVLNESFLSNEFYEADGQKIDKSTTDIIDKFLDITTIAERRFVSDDLVTSDIAYLAGLACLTSARTDKETLDYIIVAHNFGDVKHNSNRSDIVPSLAARVKHKLGIENPSTIAYDITFGCPGWLQGVIQADYFIKSGDAQKILVIGAEVLSRVSDPHDRDSMLYSDGAGAVILEAKVGKLTSGILAHKTRTDTIVCSEMLHMDKSYAPDSGHEDDLFLKMNGRKLYQYALETVPSAIKESLEKAKIHLKDIKLVLIHQANGKMDDAILKRLYDLYDIPDAPKDTMPMTISWLGNSSVATLPTLYDLLLKGELANYAVSEGDTVVFASVGAGMSINAVVYKV